MEVLTLDKAGIFAWSNSKKNKSLFATASIYDSFSSEDAQQDHATLTLYSLDIVNRTSSSQKIGTAKIDDIQFTSLNWHSFGEDSKYPYGLIASGFNEGSVGIWDVNTIIQNSIGDNNSDVIGRGLLCLQNVHSVPVQSIAFNPTKKHLIASGGVEVAIHNIEKDISDPEVFSPGDNLHEGSIITSVSWNRQVPHILGSASQNGISVVWDLKINKAIFNFSDHNRTVNNRNLSLSWNPEIPTQFAVVYDDEKTPELQMWDLRNPKGPIFCSQRGHTKGIHHLDWCLTDPSLIITIGRDNKTCVWNYKSQDNSLVSEFPLEEPCSTVQWSPREPEIYSMTTYSGKSTIYSLNNQLDHIPIWLRRPVGATFSFDGRLAVFSDKGKGKVSEYNVPLQDDQLLAYIEDFEQNFQTTNVDLRSFCDNRINSRFLDDEEKEEWSFIKAAASDNPDDIIKAIGLDKDKILKQAEKYTSKTYTKKVVNNKPLDFNYNIPSQQEAESFFSTLAEQGTKKATAFQANEDDDQNDQFVATETINKNTNWNAGAEKIIKDNILIGNIEGAVDSALKCGRVAEAFLLAYSKGADFFRATFETYVTSCNEVFVKNVIRYLVEDQISELVQKYSLEDWKECIALCLSLSKENDSVFQNHVDELALRFTKANDHRTALLLYILSKNFSRVLEVFAFRTERFQRGSFEHTLFLLRTIEKLTALKFLTGNYESNPIVDRFIYELTKTLHIYGKDNLILNLLTINNSQGFECLILRDRIIGSSNILSHQAARHFPFHQEHVNVKIRKQPRVEHDKKGALPHDTFGGKHPHQTGFPPQQQQTGFPSQQQTGFPPQQQTGFPQQQQGKPLQPGPKPLSRPGVFNPALVQSKPQEQNLPPPTTHQDLSHGTHHPPPKMEPKNFPPPTHLQSGPKGGPTPFLGAKKEELPPQGPPKSFQTEPMQTPPIKSGFPGAPKTFEQEPIHAGPKHTPFTGAPSTANTTQQSFITESQTSFTQEPPQTKPTIQQSKPQQPPFKPGMPKPLAGPVRTSQTGPIGAGPQTTTPQIPTGISQGNPISGPPTGLSNVPTGGNPTGFTNPPTGGPTTFKAGPPTNLPKPGVIGNPPPMNQQNFPGPKPGQIGNPPIGQQGFSGPKPGGPQTGGSQGGPPMNNSFGGQVGGPTLNQAGGPPSGFGNQVKPPQTQGFKPQAIPGKVPMKMPPKMPGYGGPN